MKHQENQERTQTLTNPRLNNNSYHISQNASQNKFLTSDHLNINSEKRSSMKTENVFQTSRRDLNNMINNRSHFSPEIKKQSNHLNGYSKFQGSKFSDLQVDHFENFNRKAKQRIALLKLQQDQISQNHFQSINHRETLMNLNFVQQNEKYSQKNNQRNNFDSHYTDVQEDYSSDEEFQDRFILAGADPEKHFITLTIEEKKLKTIESNEMISSQQKIQENNPEKMQIQNPTTNNMPLKSQQNHRVNQEPFEYRQQSINFSLKDSKEIRKLRVLTPIKSLKKYILRKFGYSQGARNCEKLSISFFNLYQNQSPLIVFPITDQQNLQLIVLEFIKARRNLFIRFENDGSLRKKAQRKNGKNQVQFDSDGQLQDSQQSQNDEIQNEQDENQNHAKEIRQMIRVNKTQKSRYRGTKIVRCAFCHKTNKDIENIKICGPFYGPFLRGKIKTKHYTHLLCALWCKKVYLNDDNQLKQIAGQINRSQRKECKYCDKKGAGLLCHGCNSSMHYQCGLGKCEYLWTSYELYCDKCHQKRQKRIQKDIQEDQGLQNQLIQIQSSHISHQQDMKQDSYAIKIDEKQQVSSLKISQSHNLDGFDSQKFQEQHSKTQSLKNIKENQSNKEQQSLRIDMNNRIQINNDSSQVQILQNKYKPPKNKLMSQVKIQEEQLALKQKQKPRRGRRQKKRN